MVICACLPVLLKIDVRMTLNPFDQESGHVWNVHGHGAGLGDVELSLFVCV